jgi:hypothetical protein
MKPHIIPKVILKQFQQEFIRGKPIIVMDKITQRYRTRGIDNNIFIAPSNYFGNGQPGTLENEMACKDENEIPTIINLIRGNVNLKQYENELKWLLGNNSARNPHFRNHPKVTERGIYSSEEFHQNAMNKYADSYMQYPICVMHIMTEDISFLLPDFNLKTMVLTPDIAIIRNKKGSEFKKIEITNTNHYRYVEKVNSNSMENAISWIVSKSEQMLIKLGAKPYK